MVGTFVSSSIPKDGHKRDFYRNGTGTTSDSEQAVQHSQKSNGLSSVGAISGANSNSILPGKIGVYGDCNYSYIDYRSDLSVMGTIPIISIMDTLDG